jgi:hypothetical protein
MEGKLKIGKKIVKVITIIVMFLLYFRGSIFVLDKISKKGVDENSINRVPIIVLSKGEIKMKFYGSVKEYIGTHSDYSFLIPQRQESFLLKQLQSSHHLGSSLTFQVTHFSKDSQFIEVDCFGDHRIVGYYLATDKSISPKYIKTYGPFEAVILLVFSLFVTFLSWVSSLWISQKLRSIINLHGLFY